MTLDATITYDHYIAPVERRDLQDFFPHTRNFFPGYIKMEVFRVNLADAMHGAEVSTNLYFQSIDTSSHLHPLLRDESYEQQARQAMEREYAPRLKENLLDEAERITWFRRPPQPDLAEEKRQQAKDSFIAATTGVAVHIATDKAAKAVKVAGKLNVRQMAKSGEMNKETSMFFRKKFFGSLYKMDKPKGFEYNPIDINLTDKVVEKYADVAKSNIPTGIEVGFNNEFTRGVLKHTGMSEEWADKVMGGVDFVSEFSPHVAIAKVAAGALVNTGMGFYYAYEASKLEKWQKESEERWRETNLKIKNAIVSDISAMTEQSVVELQNLLKNK